MHPLAERIESGDIRALAKAISYVENDHEEKLELLKDIHPMIGKAYYLGITGSPGAGKSTMVNHLIHYLRQQNKTVGVVAVDPTSPFSGGSILGDRVRMSAHFTDPGVFIRSMGTRGSLGGLARTTKEAVRLMDAFGFDVILVETVGVGQSELDIMKLSDTTVVVLNPGSGDVVQIFKAGIIEIADVFVINKADLHGVGKLMAELNGLLDLVKHDSPWRPPIIKVIAKEDKGFHDLWEKVEAHQHYLYESGEGAARKVQHHKEEVIEVVHYELMRAIQAAGIGGTDQALSQDPYSAAQHILKKWLPSKQMVEEKRGVDGEHEKSSNISKG